MVYNLSESNIHIIDSYTVSKSRFDAVLGEIENSSEYKTSRCRVFEERSVLGMKLEWAAHNFCYAIGFQRERTKDVDLQIPRKWWEPIAYGVVGALVWIFIK